MIKKLIFFILITVFVCPPVAVFGDTNSEVQNPETGLLSAIGIELPTEKFTRAGAAKVLLELNKLPYTEGESIFSDVEKESAAYINSAYKAGLISGCGDGKFKPDSEVTYTEFAKMLLNSLGYGKYAENTGGYPLGYINLISATGLNKSINMRDFNGAVTPDNAAIMIVNTLNADIMEVAEISSDSGSFKTHKGKTLLSEKYDIEPITGIMTSNSISTLLEQRVRNKKISIDGVEYNAGSSFDSYLGYEVKAYIHDGEDAVYVYPTSVNVTEKISGSDITKALKNSIEYTKNERDKKISLNGNEVYFYNGAYVGSVATAAVSETDLKLKNARYTLLDNNDDGIYEYIFADNYVYYKVTSTDKDKFTVYDDFTDEELTLLQTDSISFTDGTKADFSDIRYNNILAGKIPKNIDMEDRNCSFEFILSDETIFGKVTGKSDEGVTINGIEYEINEDYGLSADEIYDKTGVFMPDLNGRIISWFENKDANDEIYAYISKIEPDGDISDSCSAKILIKGEGVTVKKVADNVSVLKGSDTYLKGSSELIKKKNEFSDKVVKVVSADDKIRKIILPKPLNYGETGSDTEFNVLEKRKYTTRGAILDDLYMINSDAAVFTIPHDTTDYKNYGIGTRKSVTFTESNFECEVYGIDENYKASAMLVRKAAAGSASIKADGNIFVVEKLTPTMIDEDEETLKISGMMSGKITEFTFKEADMKSMTWDDDYPNASARKRSLAANELESGDILLITAEEGIIQSFRVLLDFSKDDDFACSAADEHSDGIYWTVSYPFAAKASIYTWGRIGEKNKEYIKFNVSGVDKNIFLQRLSNVYLADTEKRKITKISSRDKEVTAGRRAFLFYSWGSERDLVIYK